MMSKEKERACCERFISGLNFIALNGENDPKKKTDFQKLKKKQPKKTF